MTTLQAILLGILQGVAEFLPISSSGHLTIVQSLFGLDDIPLLFDVFLHLATLFAVVIFFWKQIVYLLCVFWRWITRKSTPSDKPSLSIILSLVLATCITGIIGIVVTKFLPDLPAKAVCFGFIITAVFLILSSRLKLNKKTQNSNFEKDAAIDENTEKSVSIKQGLLIGLAQGIGTLPGISRSGITISSAMLTGVERKTAGEFSFLLSIPAILGAFLLELKDFGEVSSSVGIMPLIIGCVCAFAAGLASLKFLMSIIKKGKLEWFAFYLIPIGILGIILL